MRMLILKARPGVTTILRGILSGGLASVSRDDREPWYEGRRRRRLPTDQEDIQRGFVGAGWRRVTDDFSEYHLVGNCGNLSILAYESFMGTDDPAFELVDRRGVLTYWVRLILTPRQAAVLLEEERDNHHR
jgi:hypothetical protein